MVIAVLGCAALATTATPASARSLADQPDDVRGTQQIHLLYVVPSDGTDRGLDTDGTLTASFGVAQRWLASQDGGKPFGLDTAAGAPDVTFVRIAESDAQMAAYGLNIRDHLEADLRTDGFTNRSKIYLTFYDGSARNHCASGAFPPALAGHVAALYLRGVFDDPNVPPCDTNAFAKAGDAPGYVEYGELHEILHTIGFVPSCAPHSNKDSHVSDSPHDLMYAGPLDWVPDTLDVGHDDYFDAHIPGCLDLSTSGFLQGNPFRPLPGEERYSAACHTARIRVGKLTRTIAGLRRQIKKSTSKRRHQVLVRRLATALRRRTAARRQVTARCSTQGQTRGLRAASPPD